MPHEQLLVCKCNFTCSWLPHFPEMFRNSSFGYHVLTIIPAGAPYPVGPETARKEQVVREGVRGTIWKVKVETRLKDLARSCKVM